MLSLTNLAIRRGIHLLFEQASFTVHRGYRVGVTGANGCGKSSLFALILNQLQSDAGDLSLPPGTVIAHVAQETPGVARPAIDYVIDGDNGLSHLRDCNLGGNILSWPQFSLYAKDLPASAEYSG